MCRLCELAAESATYTSKIKLMQEEDSSRLERTKGFMGKFPSLKRSLYSSVPFPMGITAPLFEARNAYTMPNNYFQQVMLNGSRLPPLFAHGATRSIFFTPEKLMLFSKSVGMDSGVDYFSSYLLLDFGKGEYSTEFDGKNLTLSVKASKPAANLLTGEQETIDVSFTFRHKSVEGRILQKEEAMRSDFIRRMYSGRLPAHAIFASADLEGYVITVPHFSPHPYLLQAGQELGHPSNRHFQEHVLGYILEHLGIPQK